MFKEVLKLEDEQIDQIHCISVPADFRKATAIKKKIALYTNLKTSEDNQINIGKLQEKLQ